MSKIIYREEWLTKVAYAMEPWFNEAGLEFPEKFKVACGVCGGNAVGLCYNEANSEEKAREIFVDPCYSDEKEVVGTLIHELIHACLPWGSKHGKLFFNAAKKLGLTGKMTSTVNTPELDEQIVELLKDKIACPYPHSKLETKKKGTRTIVGHQDKWYNLKCPDCEYQAKVQGKWLDNARIECPCCEDQNLLTKEERKEIANDGE